LRDTPAFDDAPPARTGRATDPPPTTPAGSSTRRGRRPLVPEPHAVSAPLPQPEPITPPLSVQPAPDDRRRGKRARSDDEFVDWVSGLGSPRDDEH
jgi:hypothetical protein